MTLWVKVLLLALVVGLVGYEHMQVLKLEEQLASEKQARAEEQSLATAAALKESEEYRALQDQLTQVKEQAQHDYDAQETRNAATLASARAGADKLRRDIAAYAYAAGGAASTDSVAAASERAATLGKLLAAALQADADHAGDAETNADAVRALLAAWPTEIKEQP